VSNGVSFDGPRLCLKDQPQRFRRREDVGKMRRRLAEPLRLVLRTQPRSVPRAFGGGSKKFSVLEREFS